METTEKTLDVLNDLVKINNDRVAGFEKASENLDGQNSGLRPIFSKLADESRDNSARLSGLARQYGGEAEEGTSVSGTLHRAWLEVKSTFTGNDLESILNECERGEDAIKQAYRTALENANELPVEVVQAISHQYGGIMEGHDLIKSLRDQSRTDKQGGDRYSVEDRQTQTSTENDEWKDKEPGFKPFGSSQNKNRETTAQDWMDEDELALANEVPSGSTSRKEPDFSAEGSFGPVDTGDYQNPDSEQSSSLDRNGFKKGATTSSERPVSTDPKLQELFVNELKDLLWAEKKLVDTLPKMKQAATSVQLREAFNSHLEQTQGHVQRLEEIFTTLGLDPDTTKCEAMDGIVEEGEEIIDDTEEGTAQRDVGLIFAGQKVEHYEIASYGGMVSLANTLGYTEAATILAMTLNEEKAADALLTKIAENNVDYHFN
jgi:uncharacterized protein (TIGR02284 family)